MLDSCRACAFWQMDAVWAQGVSVSGVVMGLGSDIGAVIVAQYNGVAVTKGLLPVTPI